jgi:hypothetical protein
MKSTKLFTVAILMAFLVASQTTNAQSLHKVTFYRAAPGKLLELIENLKERVENYTLLGNYKPFIIRHSQGDQWDLMIYEYIQDYNFYYSIAGNFNRIITPHYSDVEFYKLVAYHESNFYEGPKYETVSKLFETNNFFHVEMFVALPGKQEELVNQRKMENVYLKEIGRNPNLIFTLDQGTQWDCFTLGGYRDIKHFAESADIPFEKEEKAAIKAGFKGVNDISPYLRSLIDTHHDTLGVKVE